MKSFRLKGSSTKMRIKRLLTYSKFTPLIMALAFYLSGIGKMRDQANFERMLSATGLADRPAKYTTRVLPASEVFLATILLKTRRSPNLGLSLSAILLSCFSAFLVSAKLNGKDVECNCFGKFLSRLQGRWAVLRNIGLIGVILFSMDLSRPALHVARFAFTWKLVAAVGSAGSFVLGIIAFTRVHGRQQVVRVGPIVDHFTLTDQSEKIVENDTFFSELDQNATILYLSSGCQPCSEVLDRISLNSSLNITRGVVYVDM